MQIKIIEPLKKLQQLFSQPIYIVGGYVRNSIIGIPTSDIDICGAYLAQEIKDGLNAELYTCIGINNRTGTVVIKDKLSGVCFEYTTFRTEIYGEGGEHTPEVVEFTLDIKDDAKRRDFKVNAIYYDIKNDRIVDVLGGVDDINRKVLSAATFPENVFKSDGLRIMRMVRFASELGFGVEEQTYLTAKKYCHNLVDISKERIRDELDKILISDKRYPMLNNIDAHYNGLKMLGELGAYEYFLKDLELSKGVGQRADFHKYDVYEHILQTVRFSPPKVRLAALFHDIAKAKLQLRIGNVHEHDKEGASLTKEYLGQNGLKYPTKVVDETTRLVSLHMADIKLVTKERKIKLLILNNLDIFEKLLYLKQADYIGCGYKYDINPTVLKWCKIYYQLKKANVPLCLKQLQINAMDIKRAYPEIEVKYYSKILKELLELAVIEEVENNREELLKRVNGVLNSLQKQ